MRCIGALERCAWATIWTICDRTVSEPIRSERMTSAPLVLSVAPMTLSPARLLTGSGSPVSMDSSIELLPSCTMPSTGTFSPGRMRSRSPTCTWLSGTSSSLPSALMRRAVLGASPSSDLIAAEVWERADRKSTRLNSSHLVISYAVFCLKKKKKYQTPQRANTPQHILVRNQMHLHLEPRHID